MMAVFSVLATLSLIDLKILGIGMAAAALTDATVVRGIPLPTALALLGESAPRRRPAGFAAGPSAPSPPGRAGLCSSGLRRRVADPGRTVRRRAARRLSRSVAIRPAGSARRRLRC
jgi:RND superfamily putative drug exporter